jgi:hypothetical protein
MGANAIRVVGFAEAEHYLFPWHGRDQKIDPQAGFVHARAERSEVRRDLKAA